MEYILKDTNIFDENISTKFSKVIESNIDNFIKEKVYKLTVSFHVNLLEDTRFEDFNIENPKKTKGYTKKDKIYDVLSFQLVKMEEVLSEKGIEITSSTIQGENLEDEDIIKTKISEDTSEPSYTGRGKNKTRMKVNSIVPNLHFIQDKVSEHASKRLSKLFCDIMNILNHNKKTMSEILEIEETEDDEKLYGAFVEKYGELWLTTNEREKELFNRLKERAECVLKKYKEKE
ncbi:MAG: hypothetical protein FH751_12700 [Firmicutes bacterium]|nr:hypothetical protein [Bacillota bacterium]